MHFKPELTTILKVQFELELISLRHTKYYEETFSHYFSLTGYSVSFNNFQHGKNYFQYIIYPRITYILLYNV